MLVFFLRKVVVNKIVIEILTLFKMDFLGGCPLPEICHTHPTMRKLFTVTPYLTKFQKINKSCDTLLEFCWHQHFLPEISNFCFIKKYRYRLYFNTKFVTASILFESLKVVSINMVATLIVTRIDYPRLFLKCFFKWRLCHDCPWCHQQNFITRLKL